MCYYKKNSLAALVYNSGKQGAGDLKVNDKADSIHNGGD